jgi:hypothetical protein
VKSGAVSPRTPSPCCVVYLDRRLTEDTSSLGKTALAIAKAAKERNKK